MEQQLKAITIWFHCCSKNSGSLVELFNYWKAR